ncbi:Cardiolipin synthase A [bioreactor metagenome]|uniref:Cardiolipin synthase A n=1 Tax=bioreactor metagenome TaxID=1076179 RepID=A0A645H249_9ZZZZ
MIRVLASGPGCNFEGTRRLFFASAISARKALWIMTPYFVPGPEYINLLCLTAARGVDVRIIVPAHNDHLFVNMAAQNFYLPLLEAGVKIYNKLGLFSHIKALLVDEGDWGFMGSSNCDSRSFRLNFELDFVFEAGPFVKTMHEQFLCELANSRPVTLEEEKAKSIPRQFGQNICALFTPIL